MHGVYLQIARLCSKVKQCWAISYKYMSELRMVSMAAMAAWLQWLHGCNGCMVAMVEWLQTTTIIILVTRLRVSNYCLLQTTLLQSKEFSYSIYG